MRFSQFRQLVAQSCEFPLDTETLLDRLGDVELEAPTGDTTTIREVLSRVDAATYQSADEAYEAVVGNLDESFIGRKYYDDRGGVHDPEWPGYSL